MGSTILSSFQQQILSSISQTSDLTSLYYLTGGTALSEFYFHHRYSEDFDFFTTQLFDNLPILRWVKSVTTSFHLHKVEQQVLNQQLTLFLYQSSSTQPVKVDFAYFPFEHLGQFHKQGNLKISSVDDIAVNKLQAITTRTRARDYFDLMLCLQKLGWDLTLLTKQYRLKFDLVLPPESLATAFTNVQLATDPPLFTQKADWPAVINYFLSLATQLKKDLVK